MNEQLHIKEIETSEKTFYIGVNYFENSVPHTVGIDSSLQFICDCDRIFEVKIPYKEINKDVK